MIYRVYPDKDNWLTNNYTLPNANRLTGSNVGQSEELQIFKRPGIQGAIGLFGSSSLARALVHFDFTTFLSLTASNSIPSPGGTFYLRLNHKTHGETLPYSFDMTISMVSSSWDEGRGIDVKLGDVGVSNWEKRNSSTYWTSFGGDFLSTNVTSSHFDTGYENLEVDVTSIVNLWNSGTVSNNGLAVYMTSSIEDDSNYGNYYVKKFYSRHTSYDDRKPYIEFRINDFIGDDRANMQWARTGSLFLYNVVGGSYQDLSGQVVMSISDASGVLTTVTASHYSTGIYSSSFSLPSGSYSGSLFYDSWRAGSTALLTGTFGFTSPAVSNSVVQNSLTSRVKNQRAQFSTDEVVQFDVFFRKRPHTLPVLSTSSLNILPYIVENSFYAIENDVTKELVVAFGTGSQLHTKLSYNGNGNYFKFHMSNLHAGNVYKILILADDAGTRQQVDTGYKFKVV